MSNSKTWWLQWHHVKPSSKVWSEQLTASAQCSIYHNLFSCSYSCKLGRICVFLFPLILVSILSSPIKVKTNSHIITMTDEQISTSLQWLTIKSPHHYTDWQTKLHIITLTDKQISTSLQWLTYKQPHHYNDWQTDIHIFTMTDKQISTSLQWLTNKAPHHYNDWQIDIHIFIMTDK